jgi:hypothetical protein
MDWRPLPEVIDGLPNISGAEGQVEEVTRGRQPVFLPDTDLRLERMRAAFAVALHMHQPLIPVGPNLHSADLISNLDAMLRQGPGGGDHYNATIFADCYGRMGDIVPGLVHEEQEPARDVRLFGSASVRAAPRWAARCPGATPRHHDRPEPPPLRRVARHVGPRFQRRLILPV